MKEGRKIIDYRKLNVITEYVINFPQLYEDLLQGLTVSKIQGNPDLALKKFQKEAEEEITFETAL